MGTASAATHHARRPMTEHRTITMRQMESVTARAPAAGLPCKNAMHDLAAEVVIANGDVMTRAIGNSACQHRQRATRTVSCHHSLRDRLFIADDLLHRCLWYRSRRIAVEFHRIFLSSTSRVWTCCESGLCAKAKLCAKALRANSREHLAQQLGATNLAQGRARCASPGHDL